MHTTIRILGAACLGIALMGASCDFVDNPTGGTGGTGGAGGGTTEDPVYSLGAGSGGSHQPGALDIAVTSLAAGGSTSVAVTVVDQDGVPYSGSADVTFVSDCVSQGLASITSPVPLSAGGATATYTASGCSGTDTVTASAMINGTQLSATGTITVAAAALGLIEFVSADPSTIGLKGTGAAGIKESSKLTFRVVDEIGDPVANQTVDFTLSTTVGGLSLTSASAVSGADGTVTTTVRAGTVPISVKVTGTISGTSLNTQSSALTVSTAIADQDSFSLSASELNPEAWNVDGVTVDLTVLAADRFNNPVPDDTAIVFTTELGSVVAQCLTVNGACTVQWRSQEPRTDSDNLDAYSGRTTILAHTVGEESFDDANGNGVFDTGDTFTNADDLAEAWRDDNENDTRNDPGEPFVDYDTDGNHDVANGTWDGISCTTTGCTANTLSVSDSVVLVMARSTANILLFDGAGNLLTGTPVNTPTTITACIAGSGTFVPAVPATLGDLLRGQPMPAGTTIAFAANVGSLQGKAEFTVGSTNSEDPDCYPMTITASGSTPGDGAGIFEITVTTPNDSETYTNYPINDP